MAAAASPDLDPQQPLHALCPTHGHMGWHYRLLGAPPLRAFHPGRAWPHHAIALDDIEDGIFAKPKPMADFPVGLLNVYFKRDGLTHRALTLSPRLSFHAPASEPESLVTIRNHRSGSTGTLRLGLR
jgi:hypothetical protein